MTRFANNPTLQNGQNEGMVKRYVHQPLTTEHYGIKAQIQPNGKVKITGIPTPVKGTDEVEFDEVEIPASLVFKLATLLKATRTIQFVPMTEAKGLAEVGKNE